MATGPYAHTEGFETEASGASSHAEGLRTRATNEASHAEGKNTLASGLYSHAEGCTTVAAGQSSHSQGERTEAIGDFSHAQGYQTKATGDTSTAVGRKIEVTGQYSIGFQLDNISNRVLSSNNSFCVIGGNSGFGTLNPQNTLEVSGTSSLDLVTSGTWNGDVISVEYGGTNASNPMQARENLGLKIGEDVQSHSEKLDSVSNDTYEGCETISKLGNITSGTWSGSPVSVSYGGTGANNASSARQNLGLVIGTNVQAYSLTLTQIANGNYLGSTNIENLGDVIQGSWSATPISVNYGGTRGEDSVATGIHAVAMGFESKSQGNYSYAFGYGSVASGQGSVALASYPNEISANLESCIASGHNSIALSPENIAAGNFSITGGRKSKAFGDNSVCIGENSKVSGQNSYVFAKESSVGIEEISCSVSGNTLILNGNISSQFDIGEKLTIIYSDQEGESPAKMRRSSIRTISTINVLADPTRTEITLNSSISGIVENAKVIQQKNGSNCFVVGENIEVSSNNCFVVNMNPSDSISVESDDSMVIMGCSVGIGTTSPASKLNVVEDSGQILIGNVSGDLVVKVEDENQDGVSILPTGIQFPDGTTQTSAPVSGLSDSDRYIICKSGDDIAAKYAAAKLLTPGSAALSATNRAYLVVMPGVYPLTAQWEIDAEFVDIIGLGSTPLDRGCNVSVTVTDFDINVSANDVRIKGIGTPSDRAFKTVADKPLQLFEECVGGSVPTAIFPVPSFGVYSGNGESVSGTFINCSGGMSSFGGAGSTASGTFTNCSGGDFSFGGYGTASGTFTNCSGGDFSFGGNGTASGYFTKCISGDNSFGYTGNGTFIDCIAKTLSFCVGGSSGVFKNCVADGYSFSAAGVASGEFTQCVGGSYSFGGYSGGSATGTFIYCRLTSGTFQILTGTGKRRLCIDGNLDINNDTAI